MVAWVLQGVYIKTPLKKIFLKAMLDAEQLTTILAEIEAQLISRPLQRNYSHKDPNLQKPSGVSNKRYPCYGTHF